MENNSFQIIFHSAQSKNFNFAIFTVLKGLILRKLGVLDFFEYLSRLKNILKRKKPVSNSAHNFLDI